MSQSRWHAVKRAFGLYPEFLQPLEDVYDFLAILDDVVLEVRVAREGAVHTWHLNADVVWRQPVHSWNEDV